MPTQCTSPSRPPSSALTLFSARRAASPSLRSARAAELTRASRFETSRSITPTLAPASAKPATSADPIVPAPPATTTRSPANPSQSGIGWPLTMSEHVQGDRAALGHGGRVRRPARERSELTGLEANRPSVDDEVDRALEHSGDLVLRVLVLLPARTTAVAVQGRGQLRRVDGRPVDVRAHLGELLFGPIDLLRSIHLHVAIIAYSLAMRLHLEWRALERQSDPDQRQSFPELAQ